jgi:ankyrin repeat protein
MNRLWFSIKHPRLAMAFGRKQLQLNLLLLHNELKQQGRSAPLSIMRNPAFILQTVLLVAGVALLTGCASSGLHNAAANGQLEKVKKNIESGANVNSAQGNIGTPLHQAAMQNRLEIAAYLLARGANPNLRAASGSTPLYEAALRGYAEMMQLLLTNKADPNLAMASGHTPLLMFLSTNYSASAVANLVAAGADVNAAATDHTTPLYLVALSLSPEKHETAQMLLTSGAKPGDKSRHGLTPLHVAASRGDTNLGQMLLSAGADVNAMTDAYATPLFMAAMTGHEDFVEMLIRHKANIEERGPEGQTALVAASTYGHTKVCQLLLSAGARLDYADMTGKTPLTAALDSTHFEAARFLIEAGASYPDAAASPQERFLSGLYKKLLGDKQLQEGLDGEAQGSYAAALALLQGAREEFLQQAKKDSGNASRREILGAVVQGIAQGLAYSGAQYSSYQSYKQTAQITALKHSSSPAQYSATYQSLMSQYRPPSAASIATTSLNTPPLSNSTVVRLRASAESFREKAAICDEFIAAIKQYNPRTPSVQTVE